MDFLSILLDVALIGLLIASLRYAARLSRQLTEMREGRADMQRFILDFNATVARAEAGIRGLKTTARSCGDDLEKLIEKGQLLRDELTFLTESADQMASRLSNAASRTPRSSEGAAPAPLTPPPVTGAVKAKAPETAATQALEKQKALLQEVKNIAAGSGKVSSAAERELLRVLEKLG